MSDEVTRASVDALEMCMASFDDLLGGLDADGWSTQSLCPAWTVRGVAEHLGAIEAMLLGAEPGSMVDSLPFEQAGEWISSVAGLSDAEFLDRYREVLTPRRAELAAMSIEELGRPSATPVGPGSYARFMAIRVFDYWVHEQDVRRPLGRPGHESGPAAEIALDEVHRSLTYIVGKKVGLPDGMSISFTVSGPLERSMHVAVDGRAGLVDGLESPDVSVSADSTTFVLLACGRIDPEAEIAAGTISWSGDDQWGAQAARNLRFTM
jgi:uncharacterized protein (TIGR03083 family)